MFSKAFKKLNFLKDTRGITPLFILVIVAAAALAIPITTLNVQKPNTGPQVAGTATNAIGACIVPNPLCAFGFCLGPECLIGIGDLTGSAKDIAGKIGEVAKKAPDRLEDALSNVPADKLGDVLLNVDSDTFKKIIDTGIDLSPLPLPDLAKLLVNKGADLTPGILSRIPLDKLKGAIDLMPTDKCTYVKGIQYLLIPATFDILINQFCGSSNNPHPGESPTPTSTPTTPEVTPSAPTPTSALYDCSSAPGDYLQYRCDAASEPACEGEAGWQVSMHNPNTSCSGSTPICCYSIKLGTPEPTSTPTPTTRPGTTPGVPGVPVAPRPTPIPGTPCTSTGEMCGKGDRSNVPNTCNYANTAAKDTWCQNTDRQSYCYSCSAGTIPVPTGAPAPVVCDSSKPGDPINNCGNSNYGYLGACGGSWSYGAGNAAKDNWCRINAGGTRAYCYTCTPNPVSTPPPVSTVGPGIPTPTPNLAYACLATNPDGTSNTCRASCAAGETDQGSSAGQACKNAYGPSIGVCCKALSGGSLGPACSKPNKQCNLSNNKNGQTDPSNFECSGCGSFCIDTGVIAGSGQCVSM